MTFMTGAGPGAEAIKSNKLQSELVNCHHYVQILPFLQAVFQRSGSRPNISTQRGLLGPTCKILQMPCGGVTS